MTNEEMWQQWKDGHIEFDVLYNLFLSDMRGLAYKYHRSYSRRLKMEFEEWISLGGIAIYDACMKYELGHGKALKSYIFGRCLLEFNKVLHISKYQKNDNSNYVLIELDKPMPNDQSETLHDVLVDANSNVEKDILTRELCKYFSRGDHLIEQVCLGLANGYKITEISEYLNVDYRWLLGKFNRNKSFWKEYQEGLNNENIS